MKTKIISKILLSLGLVFVLGSAITQVYGEDVVTDWQCELAHEPANDD